MCGIAGFLHPPGEPSFDADARIRAMTATLTHRGPDDHGVWIDREAGIALGHRRLAVIDLSPAGRQPMISSDGRLVLTFNGEIYNYLAVRRELDSADPGLRWKSDSDTEVLLEAVRVWGIGKTLSRLKGMFALALWDRTTRSLLLARDRIGEKPLYYGWLGSTFYFASEPKALRASPAWQAELEPESVGLFFRYGCVPAPHSIFRQVRKLPPATYLTLAQSDVSNRSTPRARTYWTFPSPAEAAPPAERADALVDELDLQLQRAIALQLVADVPVGAFLSGGIDSSTIVAVAQAMTSRRIQTYTVSFHEEEYSEGRHARAVANHLGTDHTELYITPGDALDVVPRLPAIYDEPLSDASQIPTFLVSRLASRYVKVCLSGDGGDELFGGYNRHIWGARIPRWLSWFPAEQRRSIIQAGWKGRDRARRSGSGGGATGSHSLGRLQKLGELIGAESASQAYLDLVSHWKPEDRLLHSGAEATLPHFLWHDQVPPEKAMMYLDATWYLPDDVLVKLDRAAMAVGLETRAPFLDHDLVEFASTIPAARNFGLWSGKRLLRDLLYRHVPRRLVDRPKMGFGLPIDQWLRGPLREWAEDLISPQRLARHGLLSQSAIAVKWSEHQSGVRDWSVPLWDVVTFQAWHQANAAAPASHGEATAAQ